MFMLKKYIKQYRMGYKGYIPPKHPICINFQMPIYQNNKILLYILRGSKVKEREILNSEFICQLLLMWTVRRNLPI